MDTVTDESLAPAYDPGAEGLPWYRRALRQGAGYSAPSALFVLVPILFSWDAPPATLAAVIFTSVLTGFFFLGTSLVMHWPEWKRWLWLLGLMGAISLMALVPDSGRPLYFAAYVTTSAAVLFVFRQSWIVITVVSVFAAGLSAIMRDMFGVVMGAMALAIALSIALGLEAERTRRKLKVAEDRTAVLAVAAERERISRDLHDILGHSLTTIAVKADLAERLVGRDDDAARTEVAGLGAVARQALADVRATASGMREVRLATEVAAARSVLTAAGVEADTPTALPVLDDASSELLGYVVREAVTNVVRHADAARCTIAYADGVLTVADDGRGLNGDESGGSGLIGLRHRIEGAGGELTVSSSGGTTVEARLP
ncbi:sensor histidine kinase [Tessaracoccus massiliensis]|uniref:sensor histidine kinase n=1 Tax=Tessaracoccus massiliensis TaxID=1522311 RepID=UPI00069350B7|nr:sensor histidine kinase [Tessaracoccus massiliensis]